MEQIYEIPVREAFSAVREKPECGCPFCLLYKKLQSDELDIILGASMMEPDIRIKTNEQGFCPSHYSMMLRKKRMLGMGLMMESHLAEVKRRLNSPSVFVNRRAAAMTSLSELEGSCYVCSRIEKNLSAMIATAVYLWGRDTDFRVQLSEVPYFCLPHYRALCDYALRRMGKREGAELYDAAYAVVRKYIESLEGDVSWFCKKFDYRYDEEPWYNSKDSVQRAIKFLSSDTEDSPGR